MQVGVVACGSHCYKRSMEKFDGEAQVRGGEGDYIGQGGCRDGWVLYEGERRDECSEGR